MRKPALAFLLGLAAFSGCGGAKKEPLGTLGTAPPGTGSGFGNNPYCPDGVLLCPTVPADRILLPQGCRDFDQQCARDFQSWQLFTALNWPGAIVPTPGGVSIVEADSAVSVGAAGDRVWELWMDPDAVFLPGGVRPTWTPGAGPPVDCGRAIRGKGLVGRLAKAAVALDLEPDDFFTATVEQPLIDQALNFVVFEIRVDQNLVSWVVDKTLYQREVVLGLTKSLTMPAEAIEAKAAWRILPDDMPATDKERYYRRTATIVLDPAHVEGATGAAPVCIERELGLIGLHLRHDALWSTFEQIDNVDASGAIAPTLTNPGCQTCAVNVPPTDRAGKPIPAADYKWSLTGPSAGLYRGFPNVPSQIALAPGQAEFIDDALNTWWQEKVLAGTVWANYRLITTNWIENEASQPRPSLNTSLEPFVPTNPNLPPACIDCHKLAANSHQAALGLSFLPFRACPTKPLPGQAVPPNCVVGRVGTLAHP